MLKKECPEQDSNLHASRHTHLKRARLPIPPPGHFTKEPNVLTLFVSKCGAENGTRTRDPNLGKVVLYQLSYFRIFYENFTLLSASLSIAGAKVQHFFEPPKLLLHFFLKKCKRRANPFYLYSPRSQIDVALPIAHPHEAYQ